MSRRPPPPVGSLLQTLGLHRPELRAWAMYDWANSAFATTVMSAVLPVYYRTIAPPDLADGTVTAYWAATTALALFLVALVSPVLGAVADYMGAKKRLLGWFMGLGVTFTAMLYFVDQGDLLLGSTLFIVANVGFAGANVFYESLLPSITRDGEMDRVSTAGFAVGYVGGGLLLALNALWILQPERFGFAGASDAMRASFVSVAVWWTLFSIPLFVRVAEPVRRRIAGERDDLNPFLAGYRRVRGTLRELRDYREAFLFLVAFWVYNDGVGTIIKMATAYGGEVGIEDLHLIGAILLVQFVGIPFTFAFGSLASRIGTRNGIFLALAVYAGIALLGYFMEHAWHFWALAVLVATVQGGIQGLSRSLFASMIPEGKSSEFFGFYSVSSKLAGIIGPLVFWAVGSVFEGTRLAILLMVVFFLGGMALLARVDVEAGQARARAVDAELVETAPTG